MAEQIMKERRRKKFHTVNIPFMRRKLALCSLGGDENPEKIYISADRYYEAVDRAADECVHLIARKAKALGIGEADFKELVCMAIDSVEPVGRRRMVMCRFKLFEVIKYLVHRNSINPTLEAL